MSSSRAKFLALFSAGLALAGVLGTYVHEVAGRASLRAPNPTPIVYDRNGAFLTQVGHETGGRERRIDYGYWKVDPLPERVVRATLALEDRRFWSHPGVDAIAVGRALWQNGVLARRRSGASTIAMQIARMQNPQARTFWAKAVEAGTAIALTQTYGREELLAHYLRLVPYGNGSHGIAHAARWYLNKPVADLSWAEIALLSAIPQSPTLMNPLHRSGLERAKKRGGRMLGELARQGVIDGAELALAREQLTALRLPPTPRRPEAIHAVLKLSELVGKAPLSPTDPRVRASIDMRLQKDVESLTRKFVQEWRRAGAEQAAVMVVRRGTGEVLASAGSADYRDRRSGAIDFTRVQRSPGSTLKPFIYALALERGLVRTNEVMADLPEGASGIGNADGQFLGPLLPRQALANSRNVPAVTLLREIGLETTFRSFRELGLHDLDTPAQSFGLSMAIGSLPTSLERLMRAYSALADDGVATDLSWYEGQRRREPQRLFSRESARLVTHFLADPQARLPSFPRYGPLEFPFPVALKTGTSQGYRDAWVVAWSRDHMVGVWVGRGDAGTMASLTGARSAARLARAAMMRLQGNVAGDLAEMSFPAPAGYVPVELCVYSGQVSSGNCGQTLTEFVPAHEVPEADAAQPEAGLAVPAAHRSWAKVNHLPIRDVRAEAAAPVRLTVSSPEHNSRIWRNPDLPAGVNRIALKAVVDPPVPQVVWYVDGEPFATADPDEPVYWPVTPGAHRFEVRLPFRDERSRTVRVVVD